MKPPRQIPQIKKLDKKNNLKEDDIKKMEDQLKNLKTFVTQDQKNLQQKKWVAANTNKPLMNYGKQILQKRSQSSNKTDDFMENILSQSLNDFLILFNCNKYWKEFKNKNILNLEDLKNMEDLNVLDIPAGFKIKMRLKLQKMFQIQKDPISYQSQQSHFKFQPQQ